MTLGNRFCVEVAPLESLEGQFSVLTISMLTTIWSSFAASALQFGDSSGPVTEEENVTIKRKTQEKIQYKCFKSIILFGKILPSWVWSLSRVRNARPCSKSYHRERNYTI